MNIWFLFTIVSFVIVVVLDRIARKKKQSKQSVSSLHVATLFLTFLSTVVFLMVGVNVSEVHTKANHEAEIRSMGFQNIQHRGTFGAYVGVPGSPVSCRLFIEPKGKSWEVTKPTELQSEKPVVDAREVASRPEVKWWCSRPQTKN